MELDLSDKNLKQLREIGSRLGLKGPTTQSKRVLLKNIENHISLTRHSSENEPVLSHFETVDPSRVTTDEKIALQADGERPEIVKGHDAEGIFVPLGGDGIVRVKKYQPDLHDVFVPAGIVKKHGLVKGDYITVRARAIKGACFEGAFFISTINGTPAAAFRRQRFEEQDALYPDRSVSLESDNPLIGIMNLVSPVCFGSRVLIAADKNVDVTGFAKDVVRALDGCGELAAVFLGEKPEEITSIRKTVKCDCAVTACGEEARQGDDAAELVLETLKRVAEQGGDALVVLTDAAELTNCKKIFASGRRFGKGSLTVIALTKDSAVAAELAPVCNACLTLKADSAADEPYVDFSESWLGREAALLPLEKRTLNRNIRKRAKERGSAETTDLIGGKPSDMIAELLSE